MSASISRRLLITSSAAAGLAMIPGVRLRAAYADEIGSSDDMCMFGYPAGFSPEQYSAYIEKYGGSWETWTVDDSGEIQVTNSPATIGVHDNAKDGLHYRRAAIVSIAVFLGGSLVGYLFCSVIDGVVKAVTGKTGSEHVADAIKYVIGKNVPINRKVYLPKKSYPKSCDIYPPHSEAYIRCKNG